MHQDIKLEAPAVPTAGATVTLLDTSVALGKLGLRALGYHRVLISFPGLDQASAANGLIGYASPDHGTTWRQETFAPSGDPNALPQTVAAATATGFSVFDIDITAHEEVKFTFTASGSAPTVWTPVIVLEAKRVAGV